MATSYGGFLGQSPPSRRRVFFSFHYADVFVCNQIRNSWRFAPTSQDRGAEGFFDGSLWESKKLSGDESLKSLIRDGLQNTSVTVVLVGEHTWARRWVRYEIARSVIKGNGLLAVKMDGMRFNNHRSSQPGPNPLDYMGVWNAGGGRILLAEWHEGKWVNYGDFTQSITLPASWAVPTSTQVTALSHYAETYTYNAQGGSNSFSSWVHQAALAVGRV